MIAPLQHSDNVGEILNEEIFYPEDNGEPMAANSRHADYINMVKANFRFLYRNEPLIAVHSDLLWYPIEGNAKYNMAPDIMVIFDRAQVERSNYQVWNEGGIKPHFVMEFWSPSNEEEHQEKKLKFYDENGAEEYIAIELETAKIQIWTRDAASGKLKEVGDWRGWQSPRTGIRFQVREETVIERDDQGDAVFIKRDNIIISDRDGNEFKTEEEVWLQSAEYEQAQDQVKQSETAKQIALQRANEEALARQEAENARISAELRANQEAEARREAENARREAENARREAENARREAEQRANQEAQARQEAEAARLALEARLQELLKQLGDLQK